MMSPCKGLSSLMSGSALLSGEDRLQYHRAALPLKNYTVNLNAFTVEILERHTWENLAPEGLAVASTSGW